MSEWVSTYVRTITIHSLHIIVITIVIFNLHSVKVDSEAFKIYIRVYMWDRHASPKLDVFLTVHHELTIY